MSDLSYEAALTQLARIAQGEGDPRFNAVCRGYALTHGARTPRCTLLIHGYTNCPRQFSAFAPLLHARGHTVYVPRLPHHGLADRMNPEQATLTGRELLAALDDALRVAHGLGERVGVLGLSAGGSLAAYAAQHRPDVAQAVVIAPVLGTRLIAERATLPLALLAAVLPNQFRWWDPVRKDERGSPPYCYPRFSTHALGAILRLSRAVLRDARRAPPAVADIVIVTNGADESVTLPPIERLAARWAARGGNVRRHHFPAERGLLHDLIDPAQVRQQVGLVYPTLLELVDGGR